MKLLAFDVGGTEIKFATVGDGLRLGERGCVPTPQDGFGSFVSLIRDICLSHGDGAEGIAMCLPGAVDPEKGLCGRCGAMRYRHDSDVGRILSEACGCRVVLENDGKAATLAEHEHGSLRGCRNGAVFLLGTGTGGGLVIDGKVVRGPRNNAGEFSFMCTDPADYASPGQTVGSRCSATFLLNRYAELSGSGERIDGRELFARLPEDAAARTALEELCGNVAVQIYNLYWMLDLEKVAVGGGISRQPLLIRGIREKFDEVQKNAMTARLDPVLPVEIVPCSFGNDANLIGACMTYVSMS